MRRAQPPRWLEHCLAWVLPARDRETIAGDLFEEYVEARLPELGLVRANWWYLQQVIGFAVIRISGGLAMRWPLIAISVFTTVAAVWLAVMENVLKHTGYAGRIASDLGLAAISVCILLIYALASGTKLRFLLLAGGAAVLAWGAIASVHMLRSPHFEGFVLIIGGALMLQGVLTIVSFTRDQFIHAHR
jgi:hypothetical protein